MYLAGLTTRNYLRGVRLADAKTAWETFTS